MFCHIETLMLQRCIRCSTRPQSVVDIVRSLKASYAKKTQASKVRRCSYALSENCPNAVMCS
jgi:hypothetical protein